MNNFTKYFNFEKIEIGIKKNPFLRYYPHDLDTLMILVEKNNCNNAWAGVIVKLENERHE
jgi:hypothetical protein